VASLGFSYLDKSEARTKSMNPEITRRMRVLGMSLKGELPFFSILPELLPRRFRKNGKTIKGRLFGNPFFVPKGDVGELASQIWEIVKNDGYHTELIKQNATVIDAGANMGVFAVFVARNHPDATIYAFEPTADTFNALKENTKFYPNIKVINSALGDYIGTTRIAQEPHMTGNKIGLIGDEIEIKTIDSLNLSVDFLKMDVEGSEGIILRGGATTIKKNKPVIVMSAYHHPEDKIELPKLVNSIAPYNCELRNDGEEDFICTPL
jgi:FkbM family methyltransferase